MHRFTLAAAIGATAFLVACSPTPSVSPAPRVSTPVGPTASIASSPAHSPTPTALTFTDGEHRVGEDIEPGTYRAIRQPDTGGDGFCYWERVSGFGGTEAEIVANSAGVGPRVVTIDQADGGFVSDDCGTWSSDLAPLETPIADGVWIVGTDVAPGRYTADGGPSCFWQRVAGFGGTTEDSIGVGTTGAVAILATDRGFSSSNCGIWTREGD